MEKTTIVNGIKKAFWGNGIDIYEDIENDSVNLASFIPDSITFVSIIVSIEEIFNIEFPDDLLLLSAFNDSNLLINILDNLLE